MKKEENYLKGFVSILFGAFLISVALEGFLLVNNLAFGGLGGLSLILENLLGLTNSRRIIFWCMSLTLLSIGGYKRGEMFLYKTFCAFSMVSFGFPTIIEWLNYAFYINPLGMFAELNLAVSAIIGGIILAIGVLCILSAGGSTSGPDTFALIIIPFVRGAMGSKNSQKISYKTLIPIIMASFDVFVYSWGLIVFSVEIWQGVLTMIAIPVTIKVLGKHMLR